VYKFSEDSVLALLGPTECE